jgi:ribosomal protein S18 acetylase RimI-like enzyme
MLLSLPDKFKTKETSIPMTIIRPASKQDSNYIIDFQIKMAMETENVQLDASVLTEGVMQLFADPAKGKYYVAEENGQVIGCLMTTYEWSDWRCGNVLWIQSVYIIPSQRNKGVYKKMYDHIKALVVNNQGYRGIRLYVDKTNSSAQRVYEKLGMNGEHYQVYEWMK